MSTRSRAGWWVALAIAVLLVPGVASAAEWKIQSEDGKSSIKFGFLGQFRAEQFDTADGMDSSQDLYMRRARLLLGGKIYERFSFFIETDSPNIGKPDSTGVKTKENNDVYIQDWALTFEHSDQFKLDVGLLLIPLSHNGLQSAVTLLPVDYGPYSFVQSGPIDSNVGRDYGVLARGLLGDKHFEYRVGLFDGLRGVGSLNDFRYSARVAWYPFEAETGLFYTGTTLGKKKILSVGAGYDHQEDYDATAFDVFWDQPLGDRGNALTVQANLIQYDGGTFLTAIPEQTDLETELGFYFGGAKVMPFATWSEKDFDDPMAADEDIWQVGLGWYIHGFNAVLKVAYGSVGVDGGTDRDLITLQLQGFNF